MLGQFLKAKYKTSDVTAIKERKHTPWVKQIESVQPWLLTARVASLKQAHISRHHCSDHQMWMKSGSLAHGIQPFFFFFISHHNTEGKIIALVDQVSCFRSSWGCLYIFSEIFKSFRSRLWKDRVYYLAESFSVLEPDIKQKIRQESSWVGSGPAPRG